MQILNATSTFASLPEAYPRDLLDEIKQLTKIENRAIIVLDDDPTGTQTVHNVPVLTEWSVASIVQEFISGTEIFYILTNSRSMVKKEANQLAQEIGKNILKASEETGRKFLIVSRSDSTLRGHYPNEVDALSQSLNFDKVPTILIPAFFEGGRYTIDDIHYVHEDDRLIPASQTSFAQDKAFGFKNSDLKQYIEEKSGGMIKASDVISFSLNELRKGTPQSIAEKLTKISITKANSDKSPTCIVNAASYRDLEVFVMGLYLSKRLVMLRTAASVIPVLAGMRKNELLNSTDFSGKNTNGVLIVVGSYVPKTSAQLEELIKVPGVHPIEVNVSQLLTDGKSMLLQKGSQIDELISSGDDVVVFTSRQLISVNDPALSLQIGHKVSAFMTSLINNLKYRPKCIIAKGGITSSDTATKGLGVKRAVVLGQVAPGIPVWQLGSESKFPRLNYVVFPGNVGNEQTLKEVFVIVRGH